MARKFQRGEGKYRGKIPLIFFTCDEVGHIIARCPNKQDDEDKEENKPNRFKGKKDFRSKSLKDKKKSHDMAKEEESQEEDEMVYIAIKMI